MNNNQYIAELKKSLSVMDSHAREQILREIQSHADEMNEGDESLISRFGNPQTLASQYLEDEELKPSISHKARGIGKTILLGIGIVASILIISIVILVKLYSGDEFNYADENAPELSMQNSNWTSIDWDHPLDIVVRQAQVVIYWQDKSAISWNCKGDQIPQTEGQHIFIEHASCLIYLPKRASKLRALQASLVLVRPGNSTQIEVEQSNLRIAENGTAYGYQIKNKRSNIDAFESQSTANFQIDITANESTITRYEY